VYPDSYVTIKVYKRVHARIAELGTGWGHITYDERARGKRSKRSAGYSSRSAGRRRLTSTQNPVWAGVVQCGHGDVSVR
jgi:hypothetical protein